MEQKQQNYNLILSLIEDLVYSGGENNFVILNLGQDYYIQMAASRGDYEVYCEAVSNDYLEEESYLNEDQINRLVQLQWNVPNESTDNFYLTHQVDSEASRKSLANLIITTSKKVYHIDKIGSDGVVINQE